MDKSIVKISLLIMILFLFSCSTISTEQIASENAGIIVEDKVIYIPLNNNEKDVSHNTSTQDIIITQQSEDKANTQESKENDLDENKQNNDVKINSLMTSTVSDKSIQDYPPSKQEDSQSTEKNYSNSLETDITTILSSLDSDLSLLKNKILTSFDWKSIAIASFLPNGNIYYGSQAITDEKIPNGNGIVYFSEGSIYIGDFQNSKRQGSGIMIWSNGQKYIGEWNYDTFNGNGLLFLSEKDIWTGIFSNGSFIKGKNQITQDGNVYIFEYEEGKKTNRIMIKYEEGNTYVGTYFSSELTGKGIMNYSNGDSYVGEFDTGKKDGYGIYTFSNGQELEGSWENDVFIK